MEDEFMIKLNERNELSIFPLVEDVAEWLSKYLQLSIDSKNFMQVLDNGVVLCKLAEKLQKHSNDYFHGKIQHLSRGVKAKLKCLPLLQYKYHIEAEKETFFARENAANFIKWCKKIGIQDSTLFESEGLVFKKDLKNIVLTLLELGRIAFRYGLDTVPSLVKLEHEIDEEESNAKYSYVTVRKKRCVQEEDNMDIKAVPSLVKLEDGIDEEDSNGKHSYITARKKRCVPEEDSMDIKIQKISKKHGVDFKRVKQGKYVVNGKDTVFVRILRNHFMVRVGGGWDELEHFLSRRNPEKIGRILISTPVRNQLRN